MVVTKEIIKRKFMEYNELYFNSELPLCEFRTMKTFKICGQFSFNKKPWNKKKITFKLLEISEYYDFDETTLKHVILHEMIHYYLAHKFHLYEGQMAHNSEFTDFVKKFNKQHKTKITILVNNRLNKAPKAPYLGWWWYNRVVG